MKYLSDKKKKSRNNLSTFPSLLFLLIIFHYEVGKMMRPQILYDHELGERRASTSSTAMDKTSECHKIHKGKTK